MPEKIQLWVWGHFSQQTVLKGKYDFGCTRHSSFSPIQSFRSTQARKLRAPSHQAAGRRTYCPFCSAASACVADRLQVFAGCAEDISSAWTFVCSCPVLKSIALTRDRADKASCLLWEKLAEKWEAWKKPSCSIVLKGVRLMGTGLPGWAVSHPCKPQRQTSKPKKHA